MSAYSKETMRERFWELTDQKDALNAELAPHRKTRDRLRDKLRAPVAAHRDAKRAVADIERPRMGEIDNEMAVIARALGNTVGPRSAA